MSAFHDGYAKTFFGQSGVQPFGKLAGFEADMLNLAALMPYEPRNALRQAFGYPFLDDDTALVDDTDTVTIQRNVETYEELHDDKLLC